MSCCEFAGQLTPPPDTQLLEDMPEMGLHRPLRDEQPLGSLPVCPTFGGKTRDPEFARRQRLDAREHRPARPPTGSHKFIACPPGKWSRTGVMGQLKTSPERVAGVHRVAVPSNGGAPLDKCAGELEPSGRLLEQVHRL